MTISTATDLTTVTEAGIRTFLDEATRRGWKRGVIAISARPEWSGRSHLRLVEDDDVAVVACGSTLAVREAMLRRRETTWLVIITDRTTDDLGPEVCAHLVWQRPRRPDPWESVMRLFAATGLDRRLVVPKEHRAVAHGVASIAGGTARLAAAPGGTLSVEHLVTTVAAHALDLGQPGRSPTADQLVRWSLTPDAAARWTALSASAGEPLTRLVRQALTSELGPVGRGIDVLLAQDRVADIAPLGLVARVVAAMPASAVPRDRFARAAAVDREHELDSTMVLESWSESAETVVTQLVAGDENDRAIANRVLAAADVALREAKASDAAGTSRVLQAGLDERIQRLAAHLVSSSADIDARLAADPSAPLLDRGHLPALEQLFTAVAEHVLARTDQRIDACRQAVRLSRWLTRSTPPAATFAEACARHRDDDAWVDRAYDAVVRGAGEETLAQALGAVARATAGRRRGADRRFAQLLAQHTAQGLTAPTGTTYLEDAVVERVKPLLGSARVLLLVADGMSLAVASEVVDSAVGSYQSWQECVPTDQTHRQLGIAVLPTLTKVSRTSLFRGTLTEGTRRHELQGLPTLVPGAKLFHKASLDASPQGYELGDSVTEAIEDPDLPLVACVLNTVDDALDRSDPGGIVWDKDAVRHLEPLLQRARKAGRVIVLTADHGHVVERGSGTTLHRPGASSNRSRPVGVPVDDAEVLVRGNRVVDPAHEIVLAVDADVRFSAKKAGYHGGASPAEVLVPLVLLAAGPAPTGWRYASPQAPSWWREPEATAAVPADVAAPQPLFVEEAAAPAAPATPVVDAVLRSATWKRQITRRSTVTPECIAQLLRALVLAPGRRLSRESTATELGVSAGDFEFNGAYAAVERVLNVEQYAVISRTGDGSVVVLDEGLLRDQFEVGSA